jgi:predicted MFS family arabinose efflux permease
MRWTATLLLPLALLAAALYLEFAPTPSLIIGLGLFGIVFAANSAAHSYLIVHYAEGDKVSLNVGFYYMANAAGRLTGTVLSGAIFQGAGQGSPGLVACLLASMGFVVASLLLCLPLHRAEVRWDARRRGGECVPPEPAASMLDA